MSRRRLRNLMVVFWLGLFLLSREPALLWLLILSLIFLQPSSQAKESMIKIDENADPLTRRIQEAAQRSSVPLPQDIYLRTLLRVIYQRYEKTTQDYPQLTSSLSGLMDEMWHELKRSTDERHWSSVLNQVLSAWPVSQDSQSPGLQARLQEAKELHAEWLASRREAQAII